MEKSNSVHPKGRSLKLKPTEGIEGKELREAERKNERKIGKVKVAPANQGGVVKDNSITTARGR